MPAPLAARVAVGTLVRVPLHGRRVRGWVVADDAEPETDARLRPLAAVLSLGPPADVVELTSWCATRWCGPRSTFLRAASPPNLVAGMGEPDDRVGPGHASPVSPPVVVDDDARDLAGDARSRPVAVVRWPAAADSYDLIAACLPERGSAIVVVPDATRATHLARRLARSGRGVALLTSARSDAERTRAWTRARAGECIVVGGRVAAFAPVPDLTGALVVDEGEEALQDERAPTWHARDVVLERGRRAAVPVTLISPAPTLEALSAGVLLRPARGRERAGWPVVEVVDRRAEAPGLGLFSTRLVDALRATVEQGGRAVTVLNRRGRARLLACHACGELARCTRCGAAVREDADELACASCGERRPRICTRCDATRLRVLRAGVSRVRDDLAALLPRVEVAHVDRDTGEVPDTPVLIGTEAVLYRVERAGLVAFLDFDQELLAPRLRASEQALWLLVRAARLLGPRADGGRIIVQTRLPRHEVLDAAVRADPGVLAAAEGPRRARLELPPARALALVSGDAAAVRAVADALRDAGVGPGGSVERGLMVRAKDHDALAAALAAAVPAGRAAGRLRVEVDPPRV